MRDEDRLRQTLENVRNDAVVISNLVAKYDHEGEIMSVLGAVFSSWCDCHGVPLGDRKRMLQTLRDLTTENTVNIEVSGSKNKPKN